MGRAPTEWTLLGKTYTLQKWETVLQLSYTLLCRLARKEEYVFAESRRTPEMQRFLEEAAERGDTEAQTILLRPRLEPKVLGRFRRRKRRGPQTGRSKKKKPAGVVGTGPAAVAAIVMEETGRFPAKTRRVVVSFCGQQHSALEWARLLGMNDYNIYTAMYRRRSLFAVFCPPQAQAWLIDHAPHNEQAREIAEDIHTKGFSEKAVPVNANEIWERCAELALAFEAKQELLDSEQKEKEAS